MLVSLTQTATLSQLCLQGRLCDQKLYHFRPEKPLTFVDFQCVYQGDSLVDNVCAVAVNPGPIADILCHN